MEPVFNHFDQAGNAVMVDVTGKEPTYRTAVAEGKIFVTRPILDAITGRVIPLCHPLLLSHLAVEFEILEEACAVRAECTVKLSGKTGVEMEALTGVSVALLTIYDMCKAIDKGMELGEIRLVHKEGGKSGVYDRG